jgi:hypothetical protein
MRRFVVVLVSLLAGSLAFAESSVGLLVTWTPFEGDCQTMTNSGSTVTENYTFEALGVLAFLDLSYVEASVEFGGTVTNLNWTTTSLVTTTSGNYPFWLTQVDFRLVGRYPFGLGDFFTLFPLVGVEKYFCLSGSLENVVFTNDQKSDYSPWLLVAGVGTDFRFARKSYIRAELSGAYNLTSERSSSFYAGSTYQSSSGWEIQFAAGIGFIL